MVKMQLCEHVNGLSTEYLQKEVSVCQVSGLRLQPFLMYMIRHQYTTPRLHAVGDDQITKSARENVILIVDCSKNGCLWKGLWIGDNISLVPSDSWNMVEPWTDTTTNPEDKNGI